MSNPNFASLATTTIESRTRQLADNITNRNALLTRLKQRGNYRPVSGGRSIVQEIDFSQTPNVGWYSGYDVIGTAPSDTATAAEFPIREAYASVTISGLEQGQNRGRERMIDLLESKIRNAERTLRNLINTGIYSNGSAGGGRQIGGLQLAVPATPATGTYGGIDRATATWWRSVARRSSVDYGAAMTAATALNHMGRLFNELSGDGEGVDLIASDANSFQLFTDAMSDRQVIADANRASAGFVSLRFRTAEVLMDGGIGGAAVPNTMFYLNTDFIHWRPLADMDMYMIGGEREPTNQDAIIRLIGWKGNMTLSGARYQGQLLVT